MKKRKEKLDLSIMGHRISDLASKRNYNAVMLGEILGISKQAVYDIYKKENIDSKHIITLAKLFGVSFDYILTGDLSKSDNLTITQKGDNNFNQSAQGNDIQLTANEPRPDYKTVEFYEKEIDRLKQELDKLKEKYIKLLEQQIG